MNPLPFSVWLMQTNRSAGRLGLLVLGVSRQLSIVILSLAQAVLSILA